MMDSQDNTLNKGIEEEKQQEEAVSNAPSSVTTPEKEPEQQAAEAQTTAETKADGPEEDLSKKVYNSKKEVIERLKEIVSSDETPVKAEIDHLKTTFYKLHFVEREKQQKEYLEAGGDPEKYQIVPDEDEEVFKAEMSVIKEKRQKALAEIEEEKQENLKRKEDIIEKIKAMSVSPEEANKSYNDFKTLQQEWKNIKAVPADKSNELGTTTSFMWSSSTICLTSTARLVSTTSRRT